MSFTVITENRNGKLIADQKLITDQIKEMLRVFDELNTNTLSQNDLVCSIGDLQEQLRNHYSKEDFDICAAIFVNAKNYLVYDEDELYREFELMEIEIHKKCGTWVPKRLPNPILYFVEKEALGS